MWIALFSVASLTATCLAVAAMVIEARHDEDYLRG
jgi:hypothetical protein